MRTSTGLGPAFTATDGHKGLGVRVLLSPRLFGLPQSCVRLPSLADGATGTHSCRVPERGTPLLRVPGGSEGGPLDSRVLHIPGGGAVRDCSPSAVGASRSNSYVAGPTYLATDSVGTWHCDVVLRTPTLAGIRGEVSTNRAGDPA
jgi:hypothetical protein